jgi:hypothetical protein
MGVSASGSKTESREDADGDGEGESIRGTTGSTMQWHNSNCSDNQLHLQAHRAWNGGVCGSTVVHYKHCQRLSNGISQIKVLYLKF